MKLAINRTRTIRHSVGALKSLQSIKWELGLLRNWALTLSHPSNKIRLGSISPLTLHHHRLFSQSLYISNTSFSSHSCTFPMVKIFACNALPIQLFSAILLHFHGERFCLNQIATTVHFLHALNKKNCGWNCWKFLMGKKHLLLSPCNMCIF